MQPISSDLSYLECCPYNLVSEKNSHNAVAWEHRADYLRIPELVLRSGAATELSRQLQGRTVALSGYLAPSLKRSSSTFLLTQGSSLPCMLCGNVHKIGAEIRIVLLKPQEASDVPVNEPVIITGQLNLDYKEGVHLAAATLRALVPAQGVAHRNRAWREEVARRTQQPIRPYQWKEIQRGTAAPRVIGDGFAEFIFRNGQIHTLNSSGQTVEAVAVRDGRFLAVGSDESINVHAGPDTQIIDLKGRAAIPGLIDSHVHQIFHAFNVRSVDLLGARSIADVVKLISERVSSTPKNEWVQGSSGWHESLLAEGRLPTRWELDEVSPDHPVIIPRGGHVVAVNSKGLERAGITKDTPDPRGGVIVRDKDSGEATGVLLETAAYFARRVAPAMPPPEEMDNLLAQAMAELNSYGIVGAVDPVIDETTLASYCRLRDAEKITVRTDLLFKADSKEETRKGITVMTKQKSDSMLRFPGIKFMADGGVEGARLREPYQIVPGEQPRPDYHGLLIMPPGGEEEFVECLKLVAEAGLQAQVHGVGDETIDVIIRSYEKVNDKVPIDGLHWCLMHAFLPSDEAIKAMHDLGTMVTVQDHPVLLGHNQKRWWGEKRAEQAFPIRKLIDSGLLVGGGSDGPVVPVDPFLSMWWMTTRQTLLGYTLGPSQAITPEEALKLYTINNAYILGVEEERGSIEPGKLADMAVLSQDILNIDPDEIRNTKALMTMVDGKIVYKRDF